MSKNLNFIKGNKAIFKALVERKEELGLSNRAIAKDAVEHGIQLSESSLSGYFSNKHNQGSISELSVRWLCARYCIDLTLTVTKDPFSPEYSDNNIELLKLIS